MWWEERRGKSELSTIFQDCSFMYVWLLQNRRDRKRGGEKTSLKALLPEIYKPHFYCLFYTLLFSLFGFVLRGKGEKKLQKCGMRMHIHPKNQTQ